MARIRAEKGFFHAVVSELAPWLRNVPAVRQAVLENALDPKRHDQAEWMRRYEAMVKVEFLWPAEED